MSVKQFMVTEQRANLTIKDKEDPRSLINILPSFVADRIDAIPEQVLTMGEAELCRRMEPDAFDEMLRLAFWNEYNLAQAGNRKMNMSNVYSGVCTYQLFQKAISNSFKLAYYIMPPPTTGLRLEYLMNKGLDQIEKILDLPHQKPDGTPDARMADVKFKITQDLINRVKGQVVQRVEVKSQNLNVNADVSAQSIPQAPQDMDAINQRLAELEGRASNIDFGVIDVGPKNEEKEAEIVSEGN